MQIIDVTLRDGGHVKDFDWPLDYAKDHYKNICKIPEVKFIELGYWKQVTKSKNKFYNLNEEVVKKITGGKKLKNVSIMIDYHYCSKQLSDYPRFNQKEIGMIRLCSRKEDIPKALRFAEILKEYTKINVSFNIFNSTNYSKVELINTCKLVAKHNLDYVYFADTHGDMDLEETFSRFQRAISILNRSGKKVGMHLHDHSGKAYFNYRQLKKYNINLCDASLRGMGKGYGNLKLEYITKSNSLFFLTDLIKKYDKLLTMPQNIYTLITSSYKISDNYAFQGKKLHIPTLKFINICSKIKARYKDNYTNKFFNKKISSKIDKE
jgi:4-hydroxy 2-oxovalerate aldolase